MSDGEVPAAHPRQHRDASTPPAKPASIRDVAKRAGVSITTVSHALSGKRHVAPATVARIRALIPELGYVPYFAARTLQSGRSFVIGLVVPDISNQFFAEVAQGVEEYAHEHDYAVSLWTSRADAQRERRYFNVLRSGAIDGLIYNAAEARTDDALHAMAAQFPVVLVDEPVAGLTDTSSAASDHRQGGRLAADHLAALGHRHTAVFTGPPGLASSRDRTAGFTEVYPDPVVLPGDYTESTGHRLAAELLQHHREVTALFAGNDLMAFGAIAEFQQRGIGVPRDISVIGFDDVDFAARITPALTTIRQPAHAIGHQAAQLLLDQLISGTEHLPPQHRQLPVEFIIRASCSPLLTA